MNFSKVIGKVDRALVEKAEDKLSTVFLELAMRSDNESSKSGMGGDPLIFGLMVPVEHVCTVNMPTAATDGKRFYWNPKFVLKQTSIGLRIICAHEAWHAIYMHPSRRGSRHPMLWNIAVDYIVNLNVMDDFKARKKDPKEMFTKHLGNYITLKEYINSLKKIKEKEESEEAEEESIKLPHPSEDRDLTDQEIKELEDQEKSEKRYFADPDIEEDLRSPEKIYDLLISNLPKSFCSSDLGMGETLDDHIDTTETEEGLAKRISNAMEIARRMAGHIPSGLETELGTLTSPKVSWKDIVRGKILKSRAGHGRNDYTRFRTRPMFSGLLIPKKKTYFARFGCLLDTSGSMAADDKALGVSQLCSLDERSEGIITCADSEIYWDQSTKLRKFDSSTLSNLKLVGGGGTMFSTYFSDYEEHIGKCDFLIVITDGYLMETDIADMRNPGIDVIWLLTSNNSSFVPPFGRVFNLVN